MQSSFFWKLCNLESDITQQLQLLIIKNYPLHYCSYSIYPVDLIAHCREKQMLLYSFPRPYMDSCTVAILNYSMFVSVFFVLFFVAFISCHQQRGEEEKKEKKANQRLVLYHPDSGLTCHFHFHDILRPFEAVSAFLS